MLVYPDSYSLKIKTDEGWKSLPGFYQTAYSAYKNYCETAGIEPVTVDAFYGVFNILADADFLSTLITAVSGSGVLPIDIGGTGGTTSEDARMNLDVYSTTEVDTMFDEDNCRIAELERLTDRLVDDTQSILKKLAALGLTIGTATPNSDTPGTIYFRVD